MRIHEGTRRPPHRSYHVRPETNEHSGLPPTKLPLYSFFFFTIQQAFVKLQMILGHAVPFSASPALVSLGKPGLPQPSTSPHSDLRVPPIYSLPTCYTKDVLKGYPRDPMAGFIS